jgi:hypothetical protein
LDIGDVRSATQEVVPDETVEIERRGHAGVDLIVEDLWLGPQRGGHFARHPRGLLKRRALGEVEDDLELRLVVERQHLDLHRADADQSE